MFQTLLFFVCIYQWTFLSVVNNYFFNNCKIVKQIELKALNMHFFTSMAYSNYYLFCKKTIKRIYNKQT